MHRWIVCCLFGVLVMLINQQQVLAVAEPIVHCPLIPECIPEAPAVCARNGCQYRTFKNYCDLSLYDCHHPGKCKRDK